MSHCSGFQCPAVEPIICDPIVVVRDHYFTQIVPVIHTIQVVNRHHCIPVERHIYNTVTVEEGIEDRVGVSGQKHKKRHATVSKAKTTRNRAKK